MARFKTRASTFTDVNAQIDVGILMMTLFLLRPENADDKVFHRVIKRLVHLWSQSFEDAITESDVLMDHCPCPDLRSKMHPFMRHSRRRGNKAIRVALAKNFLARGGGYVTTRYEVDLKKLGLVSEKSSLSSLASSEFVARQLVLASKWLQDYFAKCSLNCELPVVNLTLDESRVCQKPVSRPISIQDCFF